MNMYVDLLRGASMEYMTIQEASDKWNISARRIQVLCSSGRLCGAVKFGRQWAIPCNVDKPIDARIKCGKYIKGDCQNDKSKI